MSHPRKYLCAVVLGLFLTSCGGTSASLATSVPTVPSTMLPTLPPTSVRVILPTPSTVVPFEQRLQATIDVAFPDDMVFARGLLWVKTDDGHVIQVDPGTNSVVGDLEVDTTTDRWHYCQGLGTDGTDVWACAASGDEDHLTIDVVRIDSVSQRVVATMDVHKVFDQHNMPFLLNHIWVLTDFGNNLVGIDTLTNEPTPPISLGARCFQVAASEASLLVTCRQDDLLLVVDPEKMEVAARLPIPHPDNITATASGIWVSSAPDIIRLDPGTLTPVAAFSRLGNDAGVSATTDSVWVRASEGFVYHIDPLDNQLTEQISNDQGFTWGNILATPDSLWVSVEDNELGLLLRFNLE